MNLEIAIVLQASFEIEAHIPTSQFIRAKLKKKQNRKKRLERILKTYNLKKEKKNKRLKKKKKINTKDQKRSKNNKKKNTKKMSKKKKNIKRNGSKTKSMKRKGTKKKSTKRKGTKKKSMKRKSAKTKKNINKWRSLDVKGSCVANILSG